ncbi:hypothetical protein [Nostocoides vanveenii]|uniref:Bacterial mobilisation domain-containing protein n=1 Tax=Nostocoides vanveenii TaxID=330835 RepID=A0ABN2KXV7_9MICO
MAQYAVAVLVRMTPEQAARLDEVQAMGSPLCSRAAAVRRLIDSLDDDDLAPSVAASSAPPVPVLHPDVVAALECRTEAYNEIGRQVRAAGHNLNTMTRLSHQIATYGRGDAIPAEAVAATGRVLVDVHRQMFELGARDRADDIRLAG